MALKAN